MRVPVQKDGQIVGVAKIDDLEEVASTMTVLGEPKETLYRSSEFGWLVHQWDNERDAWQRKAILKTDQQAFEFMQNATEANENTIVELAEKLSADHDSDEQEPFVVWDGEKSVVFDPSKYSVLGSTSDTSGGFDVGMIPEWTHCRTFYQHEESGTTFCVEASAHCEADFCNDPTVETVDLQAALEELFLAGEPIPEKYSDRVKHLNHSPTKSDETNVNEGDELEDDSKQELDNGTDVNSGVVIPPKSNSAQSVEADNNLLELIEDQLSGNSLKLFRFLLNRNHKTSFVTLREKVWRKAVTDRAITTAVDRLNKKLNEMNPTHFECSIDTKRVALLPLSAEARKLTRK